MTLVVSLTSIPPRYGQLPQVLRALIAQDLPPDRVLLSLPRRYRRFPSAPLPVLPEGVGVLWCDEDYGPATKVIPAARALRGQNVDLIYCDDDWHYHPGWTRALTKARQPGQITTGASFDVKRLRRQGDVIAQGFAGVVIRPEMIPDHATPIPDAAWPVDDIWLSGLYAQQGLQINTAPAARLACTPLPDAPEQLQHARIDGHTRAQANGACAEIVHREFGVWPRLSAPSPVQDCSGGPE